LFDRRIGTAKSQGRNLFVEHGSALPRRPKLRRPPSVNAVPGSNFSLRFGEAVFCGSYRKTLLAAEVPILESLGFEVFTPATTPPDEEFSSATGRHDKPSTISAESHWKLKGHSFYTDPWPSDLKEIINDKFDLIVTVWRISISFRARSLRPSGTDQSQFP
jgi:hypothetical protein